MYKCLLGFAYFSEYKNAHCSEMRAISRRRTSVTRRKKLRRSEQKSIRSVLLVSRGFIPCLSCNGIGNWITRVQRVSLSLSLRLGRISTSDGFLSDVSVRPPHSMVSRRDEHPNAPNSSFLSTCLDSAFSLIISTTNSSLRFGLRLVIPRQRLTPRREIRGT